MSKRLLLFAYFYPPLGGPAVQRPLKMVKYLHSFGWDVDVISVKDIVYHSEDHSLMDENKATLYRTGSRDAMSMLKKAAGSNDSLSRKIYFKTPEFLKKIVRDSFFIDDKIGWLPHAVKQAEACFLSNHYYAVMATIGPYTSGLAAYLVSKKFRCPLIIDYRDHWTLGLFKKFMTPLHKAYASHWERKILKRADLVVTVGNVLGEELVAKYGDPLKSKIQVMFNGWDEEDFDDLKVERHHEALTISYVGGFYADYSPRYFIAAMDKLKAASRLPLDVVFNFVGNYYLEIEDLLQNNSFSNQIVHQHQVDHKSALSVMVESDGLLFFVPDKRAKGIITGKLFEYLRSGSPIFAMCPTGGEAAEILKSNEHPFVMGFSDIDAIAENFIEFYNALKAKKLDVKRVDPIYNRENQTRLLVERLEQEIGKKSD